MMMKSVGLAMAACLLALAAQPLTAQPGRNCAPRQMVLDRLAATYGETRQSIGRGAGDTTVEIFAATATGSWTITLTLPDGRTCLVASGDTFRTLAESLPAPGEAT